MLQPDRVDWCDGSEEEYDRLAAELVEGGTFERLSDAKRPNSYLALSDPGDVARVEDRTFICCEKRDRRRPHQQLAGPGRDEGASCSASTGARCGAARCTWCRSRMGPLGSPIAHIGVQLTDSAYVAVNMRIMTRMGQGALDVLGDDGEFVPCLHSVGYPLATPTASRRRAVAVRRREQVHRPLPRDRARSGPTARATAATPCSARSASPCASPRPWPATTAGWPSTCSSSASRRPNGEKRYVAAAFPSACGKTNMAMLIPTLPGWKVETVGDDIAWMKFGDDGRLYAINPEAGFFGVAPGTARRPTPTPSARSTATASSPTSPAPTTATCGGRA